MAANRKRASASIGREKLSLIHVAKRDLQLDDETYRALLQGAAGVLSAKDLDAAGFIAVMARLKQLGFSHRKADAPASAPLCYGDRPGMATPAQLSTIRGMWAKWHGTADEKALSHWIERCYGISAMRFCDVQTAQKAIEGLKVMNMRRERLNPAK